jgi:peptidoglycan hydrolase CwlO-like protein
MLQEIINILDIILKSELETIKIEEKLKISEREYSHLISESTPNEDLVNCLRNETENLNKLLQTYKKKISKLYFKILAEKRNILKTLENDIQNLETNAKKIYDSSVETEQKYRKLQQEFYECNSVISSRKEKESCSVNVKDERLGNKMKEINREDYLAENVQSICLQSQVMTEYDYIENDEKPLDINENLSYFNLG